MRRWGPPRPRALPRRSPLFPRRPRPQPGPRRRPQRPASAATAGTPLKLWSREWAMPWDRPWFWIFVLGCWRGIHSMHGQPKDSCLRCSAASLVRAAPAACCAWCDSCRLHSLCCTQRCAALRALQEEGAVRVGRSGGDSRCGALGRHAGPASGGDAGAGGLGGGGRRGRGRQPLGRGDAGAAGRRGGCGGHRAAAQPVGRDAHARAGERSGRGGPGARAWQGGAGRDGTG